jgi:hypothetical protein
MQVLLGTSYCDFGKWGETVLFEGVANAAEPSGRLELAIDHFDSGLWA